MTVSLTPFFHPKGIAILGVSTSPEKLGYGVARNLSACGYRGAIHFVSQKTGELFGRKLYTSLEQVPDPVDLAVLVVPNTAMPAAIQACLQRGIHAAVIVSAGFREAGPEGAALEQQCVELARRGGLRFLGPNCIGLIDTHLPLDTTFLQPPMPAAGGIAFVSHSGAFCAAIIDWARHQGFGFSQVVSLGNQADVNETDCLPPVAKDEHTRVIVLYMEGVSDGRRFIETAGEVVRKKPVIALKVGRFQAGQKAAASHTGAMAGSDTAFEAAFAKAGIVRADTAEQMFDWARALERCPLPKGNAVAVLTDAGGPGVIAADALETNGLQLAQLSEATLQILSTLLPPAAGIHNPVDMLASASPKDYAECLKLLLKDKQVDAAMVILPPPPMFTAEAVAEALIPVIQESTKPVVVALLGSELTAAAFERFNQSGIVTYPFPERAASALGILTRRANFIIHEGHKGPQRERPSDIKKVQEGSNIEALFKAYGIPFAPIQLARNAQEGALISKGLGFPLVMKIASPDIPHKSDIGGVLLNVKSEDEVANGYAQLVERAKIAQPQARIHGVYLQSQIPPGQELIIGAIQDPQFGSLVMFGSGGVEAEGLKDVAFALGPLNPSEADDMMQRTWAGRKLHGYRDIPPADAEAVKDILIRLSWLAYENPEIAELEINPLRALARGAVALDIRIKY